MKVIIKNNIVFATHTDQQDIIQHYPNLEIITVPDTVNVLDDDGNKITKDELLLRAGMTTEDLSATIIENLRKSAEARQLELYDLNFTELLSIAKTKSIIGSVDVTVKAGECLDQIQLIWSEYETRKTALSTDCDFSGIGVRSHTYDDISLEVL